MTTSIIPIELVTAGLIRLVRDASGGKKCYPQQPFGPVSFPYAVVLTLGGPTPTGPPMAGDGADVVLGYQIDAVGRRVDEAQAMGDNIRAWVVTSDNAGGFQYGITVPGWRCTGRRTVLFDPLSVEGHPAKELFVSRARFELSWTPA